MTPLRLVVLCVAVSFAAGCMTLRYGWEPPIDRLNALTPGVSTPADVLLALGEPRGWGVVRYVPEAAPRQMMLYEYVETDLWSVNVKFLLVIFAQERYEGYLWFFSGGSTETDWLGETLRPLAREQQRQHDGGRDAD